MNNIKLKQIILDVLKADDRLWNKDKTELNQTLLLDLIEKIDEKVIGLLIQEKDLRDKFFVKIKDVYVFKTNDFRFFIEENKVDNSYTQYKNRIGLTDGKKFLKDTNDVVLNWPYKDCVLEGGQSTEEGLDTYFEYSERTESYEEKQAKRKEIFFNSVLAHDEIDRLFDHKALVNWKRFTKDGEQKVKEIKRDEDGTIKENFIIKGNNLLALHSLKKQFAGKVKLIYIDPPYNTGNDGFKYNDNFNHSTWLTFMKNRLEVARELLRDDGVIFVSIDDDEQAYLKVLMDDIFGKNNFVSNFIWTRKKKGSFLSNKVRKMTEYIMCFSKKQDINAFFGEHAYTDKWQPIVKRTNGEKQLSIKKNIISTSLNDGFYKAGFRGNKETGINFLNDFEVKNNYVVTNIDIIGKFVWSQDFLNEELRKGTRISLSNRFGFNVLRHNQGDKFKAPSTLINEKNGVGTNEDATQELARMFNVEIGTLFSYNKPVSLLKYLVRMICYDDKNAVILDYHAGSGTTAHAVLELNKEDGGNRNFIMIEQMDYINTVSCPRVQKVMEKENIDDSFIYFELAKWNEIAKEKICDCESLEEVENVFDEMYEKYFLNYNLKIKELKDKVLQEEKFRKLSLDEQKKIFVAMLDNNQMYVNRTEMADKRFGISEEDQNLTNQFYNSEE